MRVSYRRLSWTLVAAALVAVGGCSGGDGAGPEAAGGGSATEPAPDTLDRVVARVNGSPIHARRVTEATEINKFRLQAQGVTLDEQGEREMRKSVLELVIDSELMIQAARAAGLTADPQKLNDWIAEIKASFGTEKAFRDYVARTRVNEQGLREEAERQLVQQAYIASLTKDLKVDEKLLRQIYEERKDSFKEGEQVHAAFILVHSSPEDPPAMRQEARKRIEEAYAQIQGGKDFGTVARAFSQAPSAARGGDIGFFPRGAMVPQFEEQAFKTPVDGVTEIFETAYGYNILKVLGKKEARQQSFEEVRPTLSLMVAQQRESEVVQQALDRLRQGATIEILDEEFRAAPAEAAESPAAVPG
jgi:parvulin-like peptidyl-prolyl isomerase